MILMKSGKVSRLFQLNLTGRAASWIRESKPTSPPKPLGTHAMKPLIISCTLLVSLLGSTGRADSFLDLTSLTPGGPGLGAFSGTLGGVSVTGSVAGSPSVLALNVTGAGISNSTTDGTSPQFSYSTVFSPTSATTDRIGFSYIGGATNSISISFGAPITNPVFHIANIDNAQFTFVGTAGLTSMTLLNGNGGGGDGIAILGSPSFSIIDTNPTTSDATPPTSFPPTTGARSGDGSVQLNGTFSTINIGVGASGPGTDIGGGSFTLSVVPEPGSLILAGIGALSLAGFSRRRGRSNPQSV